MSDSHKRWVITYMKPAIEMQEFMDIITGWRKVKYCILGDELCPTTGNRHFQGYVHFSSAPTFEAVSNKFEKIYFRPAHKYELANVRYCSKIKKGGQGLFIEYGEQSTQGQRNDLITMRNAVSSGASMREICDMAENYQQLKSAETLMKYQEKPKEGKTEVYWYYGVFIDKLNEHVAKKVGEDCWISSGPLKNWEGYDSQKTIWLCELLPTDTTMRDLCRILGPIPYRVNNKFGSRQLVATKIYITSERHPEDFFGENSDVFGRLCKLCTDVLKIS